MPPDSDPELFDSTRGKLLVLLCRGPRTVNELMDELKVTDNAVRAQLANLQLAGLVRQIGFRAGVRKPHADYELTPKARQLFPTAHEPVLRTLIDVLRERLDPALSESLMREVATRLLSPQAAALPDSSPTDRARHLYDQLRALAPGLRLDTTDDHLEMHACGCPLASVTASHPEICDLLAAVLTTVLGAPVRQRCDRTETPRCRFELDTPQ